MRQRRRSGPASTLSASVKTAPSVRQARRAASSVPVAPPAKRNSGISSLRRQRREDLGDPLGPPRRRLDEPHGTGRRQLDEARLVVVVLVEDQRLADQIAAQALAEKASEGLGLPGGSAARSVQDRRESHSFSTRSFRWAAKRACALAAGVAPPTMTPRRVRSIVSSPVRHAGRAAQFPGDVDAKVRARKDVDASVLAREPVCQRRYAQLRDDRVAHGEHAGKAERHAQEAVVDQAGHAHTIRGQWLDLEHLRQARPPQRLGDQEGNGAAVSGAAAAAEHHEVGVIHLPHEAGDDGCGDGGGEVQGGLWLHAGRPVVAQREQRLQVRLGLPAAHGERAETRRRSAFRARVGQAQRHLQGALVEAVEDAAHVAGLHTARRSPRRVVSRSREPVRLPQRLEVGSDLEGDQDPQVVH